MFSERVWFLTQLFAAAISIPPISQRQTCCCLLRMFHTCLPCSTLPQTVQPPYLPAGLGTLSAHVQAKISKLCVKRDSWLYVSFIWLFVLLFFERKRESDLP